MHVTVAVSQAALMTVIIVCAQANVVVVVHPISAFEANTSLVLCIFSCCVKSLHTHTKTTKIHCDKAWKQKVGFAKDIAIGQQGQNFIFVEEMSMIV